MHDVESMADTIVISLVSLNHRHLFYTVIQITSETHFCHAFYKTKPIRNLVGILNDNTEK